MGSWQELVKNRNRTDQMPSWTTSQFKKENEEDKGCWVDFFVQVHRLIFNFVHDSRWIIIPSTQNEKYAPLVVVVVYDVQPNALASRS